MKTVQQIVAELAMKIFILSKGDQVRFIRNGETIIEGELEFVNLSTRTISIAANYKNGRKKIPETFHVFGSFEIIKVK